MKRSEMLKKIREHLLGTFIDHEHFDEHILKTVEDLGMIPPIIEKESWLMLDTGEMTYAIHEWDPEDETQ